jgi:hypothetical protein
LAYEVLRERWRMDRTKRELSFPFAHRCLNVDSSKNSRKRQQVLNFVRSVATVPALSRQCMHAGHQDVAYDARVRGHSDSGHRPHIINRSWLHGRGARSVSCFFFVITGFEFVALCGGWQRDRTAPLPFGSRLNCQCGLLLVVYVFLVMHTTRVHA